MSIFIDSKQFIYRVLTHKTFKYLKKNIISFIIININLRQTIQQNRQKQRHIIY